MSITIELSKYMFTPEFSEKIHTFSEKHYKESLHEFRVSWKSWISTRINAEAIETEIEKMRLQGYTGTTEDVYKKMLISARFYYRKKSKKAAKSTHSTSSAATDSIPKKKAYIRLSIEFIQLMDTFISQTILQMHKNTNKVKFSQKLLFDTFTREHMKEINQELSILKEKYESAEDIVFVPSDIAIKFAKTFQNRIYNIRSSLSKQ